MRDRPEDEKKETEKIFLTIWYAEIKNVLIKEDVEIWSKGGYKERHLLTKTNNWYFTININKVVISNKVPCDNGMDCHYIVGYLANEVMVPLFIKTPKKL